MSYPSRRDHPRLKFATPVHVQVGIRSFLANTEDISVGGIQAKYPQPPPALTHLRLLFNLPNGFSVITDAIVRYARGDRFGIQFLGLSEETHAALQDYTTRAPGDTRSGDRIAKRFTVILRCSLSGWGEEVAETVMLSRNGGRLICGVRFKIGEELRLYWPQQKRAAQIRVVFRRLCGPDEFTELGFEFIDADDFWQMASLLRAQEVTRRVAPRN